MTSDEVPAGAAPGSSAVAPLAGEGGSPFASLELHGDNGETAAECGEPTQAGTEMARLDLVLDIPVRLSVELGRTEIPIRDVVNLGRGSMIELDGAPGAPLDVRVNGVLIGRGEIVVVNEERLGLRFVEVASQTGSVKRMR
jgi:flagellar motor switch protein FliN